MGKYCVLDMKVILNKKAVRKNRPGKRPVGLFITNVK
jgi:hypothetical protein